jgi:hypothetical protein
MRLKPRDWRSDSKPSSGVDDEIAVTKATCSGNGSERVDRNGVATATASRRVTVLEPILEEYAIEARFLSKVKDEADLEVGCRETSKELTLFLYDRGERCGILSMQCRSFRCPAVGVLRPAPFLKNVTGRPGAPKP